MEYAPGAVSSVLTAQGRQLLLDWTLGTTSIASPSQVFFGLCTTLPRDGDTGRTMAEVAPSWIDAAGVVRTTGYTRASYAFGAADIVENSPAWQSTGGGSYFNTRKIEFVVADDDWPPIAAWTMCDTNTGGSLLAYGVCTLQVLAQDQVVIPEQALTLTSVLLGM
jgi:hypothetical protein